MQFVETQWLCDCAASSAVRSKWAPTSVCVDVCNLMIELSCSNRFCEKRSLPVCSSPPLTRRANPLKRTPALLSLHSYHQKFSSAKTLPCSHHLHPKNTLSRSVKIQNTETRLQTVAYIIHMAPGGQARRSSPRHLFCGRFKPNGSLNCSLLDHYPVIVSCRNSICNIPFYSFVFDK